MKRLVMITSKGKYYAPAKPSDGIGKPDSAANVDTATMNENALRYGYESINALLAATPRSADESFWLDLQLTPRSLSDLKAEGAGEVLRVAL